MEYLVRQRVPYAVGIPGHGSWNLTDALLDRQDEVRTVQVMHEQSAVHLADGYYRASGRPLLAFTSVGPGAANTVVGMATAYADSTAVALMTGSVHTHMRGHGVMQELDRRHQADNPRLFEPVVKEWWQPSRVDELPFVLHRAWNQMLSGRPGPILLDLPFDIQADAAEVTVPEPDERQAVGRVRPAASDVERAAALLREARSPVIVAGGGVITADASDLLTQLASRLGAPVVTTWMGKGAIDETHELNAWSIGDTASTSGNALASSADVILAVGCRFTDWSSSSWRKGVTFAIPPTRLIHIDIDPREIGKNYPVAVGLVADARAALADLLEALGPGGGASVYRDTPYFEEIQRLKQAWQERKALKAGSHASPMTQARAIAGIQAAAPDAIVTTGAGLPQSIVRQNWVTRRPRTHITSGGYSTMGFTVPAAIGARLARPDAQVIGISGDGDFLQTMQEMATAVMLGTPVCFVVLDNSGWLSIKGGQLNFFGRSAVTDFLRPDGSVYTIDYRRVADAFGLHAQHVRAAGDVQSAVELALAQDGPALVHVEVAREFPDAGLEKTGWWDAPVPQGAPQYS
ncbi:MAG: thiamine pyrophosphate-binding protein, partial [Chloroflexi bacterium]|nr:thiamine pyrophosphate-binding protein [Chloroflexota bacterium]